MIASSLNLIAGNYLALGGGVARFTASVNSFFKDILSHFQRLSSWEVRHG